MAADTEVPEVGELLEQLERHTLRRAAVAEAMCEVCCEVLGNGERAGCSGCSHRYCRRCVGTFWEQQIFSGAHARLHCLFGGCGARATDADVAAVVQDRVFRRMLYFRARDAHAENPDARFCAADACWALLCTTPTEDEALACKRCGAWTCAQCEQPRPRGAQHRCVARRTAHRHSLLFSLWASTHTKACPECGTRIQRSRGCAHMTCARCSAYFCWRCRGFLHSDCPARGRACVCDRLLTGAAYSGLVAIAIVGAPVILTGALIGGAPWLVYRLVKRSNTRHNDDHEFAHTFTAHPHFDSPLHRAPMFAVDDLRARARRPRDHHPAARARMLAVAMDPPLAIARTPHVLRPEARSLLNPPEALQSPASPPSHA